VQWEYYSDETIDCDLSVASNDDPLPPPVLLPIGTGFYDSTTYDDEFFAQTYSNVLWHKHLGFQTDVTIDGLECNCTADETEVPASLPTPDVHATVLPTPDAGEGATSHCINDHPSPLSPMQSTVDDKERAKQRRREERKRNRPDRPLPTRMDEHVRYDPGHAYVTRDQQRLLWHVQLIQHGRGGDVPDQYDVRMDLGGKLGRARGVRNYFEKAGCKIEPTAANSSHQNGPGEHPHNTVADEHCLKKKDHESPLHVCALRLAAGEGMRGDGHSRAVDERATSLECSYFASILYGLPT